VNFGFLESLFEKQKNNILVKLNAPWPLHKAPESIFWYTYLTGIIKINA
jgi:hypothetical protein